MELWLATTNPGKLRDFAGAPTPGFELVPLPRLAEMPTPEETADTFAGNALLKAQAYSRLAPGLLVLADDSGLEVDCLRGAPGVRSARFAADAGYEPDPADLTLADATPDQRNNALLAMQIAQHAFDRRTARYRAALALARDGEVLATGEGTVEGEVIVYPRGEGGFGYDPHFLIPEQGHTMAELSPELRLRYSHRVRALQELLLTLPNNFAQSER